MGERQRRNGKWLAKCKRYRAKIRRREKELAKKGVLREDYRWLSGDGIPLVRLSDGTVAEDCESAAHMYDGDL